MTVRRKYKHFCSLLKVEDSELSTEVAAIKVIQFMRDKEQQEVLEKLLPIIQEPEGPLQPYTVHSRWVNTSYKLKASCTSLPCSWLPASLQNVPYIDFMTLAKQNY